MSARGDFRDRPDLACRAEDPELFFPVGEPGSRGYDRQADVARDVCRTCPAVIECLSWALTSGIEHGIVGGTDPREREALRDQLAVLDAVRAS
jgi:WhiB family redox-sensing transcriptional regulator